MTDARRTRAPGNESEAVIFDLDGTLADTLEDIADAMNGVLVAAGLPPHTYDEYRLLIGHGLPDLVRQALPAEVRDEDTVAGYLRRMLADYGEHCLVKTRLYDGVPEALARLRRAGLRLAVLSNKADELTRRIVAGLVAPATFDIVMGARPDLPLKPDPASSLLVAERLGVAPAAVAYIGDSDVDMQTARAAGMLAVGAAWGLRGREELVAAGAEIVLDRPLDLPAVLGV